MTRQDLPDFMRRERYAVQASVAQDGGAQAAVVGIAVPGLIHIRVTPVWIRYSNFNAQPPEIVEFKADALR